MKFIFYQRKFPSGVIVIQSDSHSDEKMGAFLKDLAEKKGGVNAIIVSVELSINIILASELLQTAEQMLHLCRDTNKAENGIIYYSNLFIESSWASSLHN